MCRSEFLGADFVVTLAYVRAKAQSWRTTYETERPHCSLGGVPPVTYLPNPTPPLWTGPELSA
jgi:transposase InsO family protein